MKRLVLCGLFLLTGMGFAQAEPTDAQLEERLRDIYANIDAFSGLEVRADSGVVTLSGEVLNAQLREDAVQLAAALAGVVYVVDNSELETDVERTLSPALTKLRAYWDSAVALLPLTAIALVVLALFWLLSSVVARWQAPYRRIRVNELLRSFIRQFVRTIVLLIGVVLALDIVGATPFVAAILGTAGVAGLAIGFAFKDIIENYLAGVLMSLQHPFARGDVVRISDYEGKVVRLTARELVLMTLDGNHVRIPNATVFKTEMINYTRNPRRRFDFLVGVDVEEDLQRVQDLGLATLRQMKGVMSDPAPSALIRELGDFNVIVQFLGWVDQREADFLKVNSQAIRLVKETFDEAGVLMPEPITNVRVKQIPPDEALVQESETALTRETPASTTLAKAQQIDVAPDEQLEAQIREDQALSDDEDLLRESAV